MRFFANKILRVTAIVLMVSALVNPLRAEGDAELGKKLFKANCASCHKLDKKLIGPALGGVSQRRSEEWLLAWIRNNAALRASGDADAIAIFEEYGGSIMTPFENLSEEDIKNIIAYTDEAPTSAGGVSISSETGDAAADGAGFWSWFKASLGWNSAILFVIFAIVIQLLLRLRNLMKEANGEKGTNVLEDASGFVKWLYRNKRFMTAVSILVIVGSLYMLFWFLMGVGVEQHYQPEQPIAFSHKIHAGDNQLDCNYCHSSARSSKMSGIPSANVCMNCHKAIDGSGIVDETGQLKYNGERSPEIAKIYSAIGWDPDAMDYIEGYEEKPIKWIRVHNLPDLAYFNHAQHVTAGQVECQTCHGPVEEMDEVYQYSELTMGWCINCHRETEVKTSNGYYSESMEGNKTINERLAEHYHNDAITVEKIGGLECGKCHY